MRERSGAPAPLGATFDGDGVNFALYSAHATAVELCLFDAPSAPAERVRLPLTERTGDVWHSYVPGLRPGQLYGYRVHGPWDPAHGHRFNPAKLLLDPYTRRLGRSLTWNRAFLDGASEAGAAKVLDATDSAPFAPLASVPDPDASRAFDWRGDRPPHTPWERTLIYELHVKGFSAANPALPERLRGTYLGVAAEPSISHLKRLGVTAVELLPIHAHVDERRLFERQLTNYWGYNTLAYFVPDERFAVDGSPAAAPDEFKAMVRALHQAGIEVILDVVYNHTGEGDECGPTLSFRGIDNRSYYRHEAHDPGRYDNSAGTGNTLDADSPPVAALVVDSLRYWVEEMHVDGFRFDLASSLARHHDGVDPTRGLCRAIADDPVLSQVKLIAEPWDAMGDGYLLGRFPREWSEWNDRYRNDVRRFWRGDAGARSGLATRLAGSSDVYEAAGRGPRASVNFVTSHDGFTLSDLVAYDAKHNEANGEANADGESNNLSWNSGTEGDTTDEAVLQLRERRRRNFMLTLMLSLGVPMISGGDELGRSQAGNNNAYCHDGPLTWTPWTLDAQTEQFLAFVQSASTLRRSIPALERQRFFDGRSGERVDVLWLGADGRELTPAEWSDAEARTLGVLFDGRANDAGDASVGRVAPADHTLLLMNAAPHDVPFLIPAYDGRNAWRSVVATASSTGAGDATIAAGATIVLQPHSAVVLRG